MKYPIEVKNISKYYRLYQKPVDRLKEAAFRRPYHEKFHSLSNVSLRIGMGETFGIIGDNGAGKSTLLKILAGTLQQTSGEVTVNGKVSALLELGAGFHTEFTGRQNIWMNASLLGLKKDEIAGCEDEIIAFSELGSFIDRPIKTYSSGMVVRLAFSIAAMVDPDILIIDEALSVGDQHFQKKCVNKILEIKEKGKIIVFCSHSLYLINKLCDRSAWLDKGRVMEIGRADAVSASYESFCRKKNDPAKGQKTDRGEASPSENTPSQVVIKSVRLNGQSGDVEVCTGEDLVVEFDCEVHEKVPFHAAAVLRRNDELVCHGTTMSTLFDDEALAGKDMITVRLVYRNFPFNHGKFFVEALLIDNYAVHLFYKKDSGVITVHSEEDKHSEVGLVRLDHDWTLGDEEGGQCA